MASYGAAVQRPSATSANPAPQAQRYESKQNPNLKKMQPFPFQITCPFSIPSSPESAAARIIKNLGKFGLYYAEFVWIVLFIALIPEHEDLLVRLISMKLVAIFNLLLPRAGTNFVLFRWLNGIRHTILPWLAIRTCLALMFTNARIHLLVTLVATLPIILVHAVLWKAKDCSLNEEINQEYVPFVHTV